MAELESIAQLLDQSLEASTAKSAEANLKAVENQPGFVLTLMHVVASRNLPAATRLAGSLFFKNFVKRKWIDENGAYLIPEDDVVAVKREIVPLMIALPGNLQVQIGEAISVIADSDFPHRWPDLLDELIARLSTDDFVTNRGVLTVAHSIFKRWRPLFRSDDLFLEIKMVLDKFAAPFMSLLQNVDEHISNSDNDPAKLTLLFDVLLILVKLYYDLNCQDIPEFFEDNVQIGMGIMHKYLAYQNLALEDADEEDQPSIVTRTKSCIQELVQLYTTRYDDVFGPMVNEFIQTTWGLLTTVSLQPKNDVLISKSFNFMTAVTKIPKYFEVFNSEAALNNITVQIILPNITLRESDEELFEDDPIEYIRRDLEGSDSDTRRRGCTDFLKELKEKNESLVIPIVLAHIKAFFAEYAADPSANWKCKDLCIYLFSTLAIRGTIGNPGVSSTSNLLDVVDFFTKEITPDLMGPAAHPILKVDAIKYIYTFRNQLNKSQLIEILPVLANLLQADEFVVYTYAAITIERILSIRESNSSSDFIFKKADLAGSSHVLLQNLFNLIFKQGNSPEKLAENEFLMKTVYRVLLTSEELTAPFAHEIAKQLLHIISIISKNPSNPRFSHYCFESLGVVVKFNKQSMSEFMEMMMPQFLEILSEDVQEFTPYSIQIIAYCIEQLPAASSLPPSVSQLCQPILSPAVWELKGNIPALTRLLKDILRVDPTAYPDLVPVLGVFQRLIASKTYDENGFELLEYIVTYLPLDSIVPYVKQIAVLLLQRLQNSRTEKYVKKFVVFLSIVAYKRGSDFVVDFIDGVQVGLFRQIWSNFVINTLPTMGNLLDRKIAIIGILAVLTTGTKFSANYSDLLAPSLEVLVETATSDSIVNLNSDYVDLENLEEITTFGSSFSRLTSISEKSFDPLPEVDLTSGVRSYVREALAAFNDKTNNGLASLAPQLSESAKSALHNLGFN
ncbi:importin-alpha export receptor [Lachancea thermotolerans CBS 6340]|uniref:KLTH0G00858p n=1 Tax=Lachancea thermotolerans (strain ATCC 56472 / CBS 6340 / NRRL Y-8284) TaxID=559295 RepID=C5DLH9_LACTC|nr:KLTH0G00858p [Lachancea thermotolerans CBS 6340]CAR24640.1 KLTH0G00858p [Lachancea thermotolerans CBS 6340]